jgi:SAM-dependent methyltransferase
MNNFDMEPYFSGRKLYGDDFSAKQIEEWYADEAEAYFELSSDRPGTRNYAYHALNMLAGFNLLPDRQFDHALGLGSAFGDEFLPIIDRIKQVTILESSEGFSSEALDGVQAEYVKPNSSGDLPFSDESFDYAQSLGVLHHIPNVSHVVNEIRRCLSPEGYFLLREPIVSMGDWRRSRKGLTKRERGLPLEWLLNMAIQAGFQVVSVKPCLFLPLPMIIKTPYKHTFYTKLDLFICSLLKHHQTYHPKSFLDKLQPTSVFLILQKKGQLPMQESITDPIL